jgi:hypothetical protein
MSDELSIDDLESLQPYFTVIGVWPETKERYLEHVAAQTPRQAEEFVQMTAKEKGGVLWVCGVFDGKIIAVDTYATFIDPDIVTRAEF